VFIGHFAVGFAAKRLAPRASLGTLFFAAQFIDLLWPVLLLAGVERVAIAPGNTAFTPLDFEHYPWSHSLLAVANWALLVGVTYFLIRHDRRTGIVLGLLVVSHWLLDLITHRPDLPLWPGSQHVGLGLWNSVPGTLVLEIGVFVVGVLIYLRTTRARDAIGRWALAALIVCLAAIYAGNLLGPPPPDVTVIAWVAQAQWLLVAWGYWIDRHRETVEIGAGVRTPI
jgi:membrane-bound metal-dependent hydrolase YbcI (DUF457 family)